MSRGYPQKYPHEAVTVRGGLWTLVDVDGRTNGLKLKDKSLLLDVYGRPWKSLDVYGWLPGPDSESVASS